MKKLILCGMGIFLGIGLGTSAQAAKEPQDTYFAKVSSDTIKRREEVVTLARSRDPKAPQSLMMALADKDPMTRTLAATGLGSLRYAGARQSLSDTLAKDSHPQVREAAARSLSQIGDPAAVDALAKALKDPSDNVKLAALSGIARYRGAQARTQVEATCKDKNVQVRRTAVFVLGRLEDPASVPVVQSLLKDPDASVRAGAIQSLGELHSKESKALIQPYLKDADKGVQSSAARSLLMFGDPSGLETAKTLAGDSSLPVRLIAIDALGWSPSPEAGNALQSLLTSGPADSRGAVQEALARNQSLRTQK